MGHIIAVYGAHGGAGATTLAVNLAVRLKQLNARVLLMDMNLQQGDIPVFLKMQFQYTLLNGLTSDIDTDRLDEIVLTHDSGIKVLMALPLPSDAKFVLENMDKLALLLDVIQSEYDLIVVDIGRYPDAVTLEILKRASSVILVMHPTLSATKNARFALDWFKSDLAFSEDKIVTVLNQVNDDYVTQKLMIPTNQIEKHFKLKFEAQLPLDAPTTLNAIAKGQPITQNPHSPNALAQALDDFGRFVFDMLVYNDDDMPDDLRLTKAALYSQRLEAPHNKYKSDKIYSNRREPITILIVHVIGEVRTNLTKLLAFESDMNVIGGVGSSGEALTMAKELRPNIILMQVDVPETDVFQTMTQIRDAVPITSIILLTKDMDVELLRQGQQAGAKFALSLPVSMDDLYNSIRAVYETARNPRPANPEPHGSRPSFFDSKLFRRANMESPPIPKPAPEPPSTPISQTVRRPAVKQTPPVARDINSSLIKILVVDQTPNTRENIKKFIAFEEDMKVVGIAVTGREAVDMAKELKPDIVLMGLDLPEIDGLQATRLIKNAIPRTGIIVTSTKNDAEIMRGAMLAGADNFLLIPIGVDDLYDTIHSVFNGNNRRVTDTH